MEVKGLQLFPILLVLWTTSGLITSYILRYLQIYTAASLVGLYFPRSPFSIITLVVCAILSSIMAIMLYIFQTLHPDMKGSNSNTWYQRALLAIGLTACLGLTITALSLPTSLQQINILAVAVTFWFGAIYISFQAICFFDTSCCPRYVNGIRLAMAVTFIIALLIFYTNFLLRLFSVCNSLRCLMIFDQVEKYAWCIAFACFELYVLTFYKVFQKLQLTISKTEVTIKFRENIPEDIV